MIWNLPELFMKSMFSFITTLLLKGSRVNLSPRGFIAWILAYCLFFHLFFHILKFLFKYSHLYFLPTTPWDSTHPYLPPMILPPFSFHLTIFLRSCLVLHFSVKLIHLRLSTNVLTLSDVQSVMTDVGNHNLLSTVIICCCFPGWCDLSIKV